LISNQRVWPSSPCRATQRPPGHGVDEEQATAVLAGWLAAQVRRRARVGHLNADKTPGAEERGGHLVRAGVYDAVRDHLARAQIDIVHGRMLLAEEVTHITAYARHLPNVSGHVDRAEEFHLTTLTLGYHA
jgi:hypothetical protein